MTRYWVIAPYEATLPEIFEKVWQFDLANGVISIGWSELGDISNYEKEKLRVACEEKYPNTISASITRIVNMLWNFYREMKENDIVIARRGTKKLAAVGTVKGTAYFSQTKNTELTTTNPENFHHNFIDVHWHDSPQNKEYNRIVFGIQTLYEIDEAEYKALVSEGESAEIIEEVTEGVENRPQFFLEKYLEQFIIDNFDSIFEGKLILYRDPQNNVIGQQYRTDVGIIDILAIDTSDKSFVVIELKKGREADKVVGQTLRYMGWLSENICKDGQTVKGMIICQEADDKLYYALKATQNIELKYYQIDFKLKDSLQNSLSRKKVA